VVPNSPLSIVLITAFEFFFSNSFNNTNYTNLPLTNRTEQNRERERESDTYARDRSINCFDLLLFFTINLHI
jgi:hypothetical protein